MLNEKDSSWVAQRMYDSINILEAEKLRPCLLHKPKIYLDGNMWCALLGVNIQEGVCGFGESPDEAMRAFDKAWYQKVKQ